MAKDESISHPNDNFIRSWYSKPESAAELFAEACPESLKSIIKPTNLKLENTAFIDQVLRTSQSDLLWGCYPDGASDDEMPIAYFYLLLEHQSSVDRFMPLRILLYIAQIWTRWLKVVKSKPKDSDNKKGQETVSLPIIFPLVLYQNPKEWTAALSLSELIDSGLPDDLAAFFPDFKFQLRPVRDYLDEDLPPGLAKMGISVMKLMWDSDFSSWLDQLREMLHDLGHDSLQDIEVLLVYASTQIEADQKQQFLEEIQTKLKPMTEGTSIYDSLIAEGVAEGKVEGIAEGEAKGINKGELQGKSQLLIKQLETKFPSIAKADKDLVFKLNSEQLDELAIELFSIESLKQLREWFASV